MKKILLSLLFTLVIINSFSQAPSWVWAQSAGGNFSEEAASVAVDASGNSYITGYFGNTFTGYTCAFGSTILTNVNSNDVFIAKYDPSGVLLWAKSAGGTNDDRGKGIAVDASGNVYVTGQFNSTSMTFDTITISTAGFNDIFIAKYNSAGNIIWAKNAGGASSEYGNSIALDAAGSCYITGVFYSATLAFGSTVLNNPYTSFGGFLFYSAKYDSSGNPVWAKTVTGSSASIGNEIAVDATGNSYVTGYFSTAVTFDAISLSGTGRDIFIVKYDPLGNVIWARSANGTAEDVGTSIAVDASGNVYMCGYFKGTSIVIGTTTLTNSGAPDPDIVVAKYNSSGTFQWAKKAIAYGFDMPLGIAADASGCYVTGYFAGSSIIFGSTTLTSSGATTGIGDIFVAKYNTTGSELWAKNLMSSQGAMGAGIAIDATGSSYITGYFQDLSLAFGSTTLSLVNQLDIYIAKLGPSSTVGLADNSSGNALNIYPNPATDKIEIETGVTNEMLEFKIYNSTGELVLVKNESNANSKTTIDVSGLRAGVYFIEANSSDKSFKTTLIIQR